ncbi:MAG: hypothetical protein K0S76_2486 [Herbinix sp.]|jgi:spore germination protein|nr:hypothetical protein [Herbinix sp.]
MIIHVVQEGDTIDSIATTYEVPMKRLIYDNGLKNPDNLVIGQAIVITYPEQIHVVQEGDTLISIADFYGVTIMQLLRNNPFLSEREYLFPDETIVIRYETIGQMLTNGYAFAFIDIDILEKTLPYLTYLSVYNYRTTNEGDIISYYDDTEIIRIIKEYEVIPLMLLTTTSTRGDENIEAAYEILLNQEYQDRYIERILAVLQEKGFYGINITFQYVSISNQRLHDELFRRIKDRLTREGYLVFVTINPNLNFIGNEIQFERVDYSGIGQLADGVMIMTYNWGSSYGPPAPVSSINLIRELLDYTVDLIPPEKVYIGLPILGYDWELPYVVGRSRAVSLTLETAIDLAYAVNAVIQFDETSQTPFFQYEMRVNGRQVQHIVWFIDARSMEALVNLVSEYGLLGTGIWNIMNFIPQLWLVISSQYDIVKDDTLT